MSSDDQEARAAAQMVIDDEPDDWCVDASFLFEAEAVTNCEQGQADLQHGVRR